MRAAPCARRVTYPSLGRVAGEGEDGMTGGVMSSGGLAAISTCALAVAALLFCYGRGWLLMAGAFKVVASSAFVALGLQCAPAGPVGQALLLSLALCWLGDVLLIPRGAKLTFALGLGSFLLGHLAFAVCFWLGGAEARFVGGAALAAVPVGVFILRWLGPHTGSLSGPVRAYVIVILLMVSVSVGATAATGDARLVVGAAAFAVSDVAVARERFVTPSPWNRYLGLPLYYGAVLLLAASA